MAAAAAAADRRRAGRRCPRRSWPRGDDQCVLIFCLLFLVLQGRKEAKTAETKKREEEVTSCKQENDNQATTKDQALMEEKVQ